MTKFQPYSLLAAPEGALQIPIYPQDNPDIFPKTGLKLSLVIPTFNERENIEYLISQLSDLLDRALPNGYELILVDDDSPDRTWELAQKLTANYPQLRVMRRQGEKGLASAVVRGWQEAQGDILGVIDADLQHPPEILLALLDTIEKGADLALASRHVEGGGVSEWSLLRRFLSRGAQILGLILLPDVVGRVSDPMSGYFMVRREAIAGPILNPTGYKILLEVLGKGRIKSIGEVGYVFQERHQGESKVTGRQWIEYIFHLLRLRSQKPLSFLDVFLHLPLDRFIRFGLVGLTGVFVDMAILYFLSDPTTLGWGLTRSKIIAAEVAIINNFIWNDNWTFRDLSIRQKGWRQRLKRFLKFNVICLAGLVLNVLLLNFLFNRLGVNRYGANFIAIALVTIWNFWVNLKLSWRVTK